MIQEASSIKETGSDKQVARDPSIQNLDELIERLPVSFPLAAETISNEIAPLLIEADEGIQDHYITLIKKKTNAASKRAVKVLIKDAIDQIRNADEDPSGEEQESQQETVDPEILERVEEIKQDPLLFKRKIDTVNQLGVVSERRTTGLYCLIVDSAKLPMGQGWSDALAGKNSGPQGSGKSLPLFQTLKLYSANDYHLINNGSAKSLYNMEKDLRFKALILTEALALEGKNGDNELAYCIRSLVSEGILRYQYTGFEDNEKVTKIQQMAGPTSLITTTIKGKLEEQLEDRLIQLHPNTSNQQTRDIISRTADLASGNNHNIDEQELKALRLFHSSLLSVDVVIPFASELSSHVTRQTLPISARRAFKRVISGIKTVALVHQHQRQKDEYERVVAEMSDYAIVYQLMNEPFKESLGQKKRHTDKRIRIIESEGVITPRGLAEKVNVTVGSISQWMRPLLDKGVLVWCDNSGVEFPDTESRERAKRTGEAYVRIQDICGLPSPYMLTGDEMWAPNGELFEFFDLELDDENEATGIDHKEESPDSDPVDEKESSLTSVQDRDQNESAVKAFDEKEDPKTIFESRGNRKSYVVSDISLFAYPYQLGALSSENGVSPHSAPRPGKS